MVVVIVWTAVLRRRWMWECFVPHLLTPVPDALRWHLPVTKILGEFSLDSGHSLHTIFLFRDSIHVDEVYTDWLEFCWLQI